MKKLLFYILLCLSMSSYAQFEEHFTDGGFNQNPHWDSLAPLQFRVFDQVLRTTGDDAGGKAGLVTVDTVGASAEWSIYIRLGFEPTDTDNVKIILVSDEFDIRGNLNGYFVRIGQNGTNDGLDFYRKDGSNDVLIKSMYAAQFANGADGNLKVIKNNLGKWVFYWKNFDQADYVAIDSAQENTYTSSSYFGILCTYTFASKDSFWFDDVYSIRRPLLPTDITPPVAVDAKLIDSKSIDVYFDEAVDVTTAQIIANYVLSPSVGNPISVEIDANNNRLAHLRFLNKFSSNTSYSLTISNIKDSIGNVMATQNVLLLTTPYYATIGDVLVNEIMVKPPTTTSLPNRQYVELKNKTNETIRLNNWTINGKKMFDGYLQPNGFVILCDEDDSTAFKPLGNTVGVENWRTLNNDDVVLIKSDDSTTIDSLPYLDVFYKDAIKQLGGWSLELNTNDYFSSCPKDVFWEASSFLQHGSPGADNNWLPSVLPANSTDSMLSRNSFEIRFSLPMLKTEVENINNYSIDNGINIQSVVALDVYATKVKITLSRQLDSNIIYHLVAKEMSSCFGLSHIETTFEIALTSIPQNGELLLNEVLYQPNTGGVQFIEVYNNTSNKLFKLKDVVLTQADVVSGFDLVTLKMDSILGYIFPNSYIAYSKNKNTLQSQYRNTITTNCINVNLPLFDSKDDLIVLKGADNTEIDRLQYNNNWHFPLLVAENKTQGISLERTDFNVATQNKRNWHSAAKDTNATPGYENSLDSYELLGDVHIIPEIFSPDGDGNDDIATITYSFNDDGSVVNAYLYNADGRLANHLVKDVTIPKEGVFVWNGDDENGNKKDVGIYFLVFERKLPNGKKIIYKRRCVLAAKLN